MLLNITAQFLIIPVFICLQKYAYKPKPDSCGQRLLRIEQHNLVEQGTVKNMGRGQRHVLAHCCTLSNIIGVYLIRKLQHKGHQKTCTSQNQVIAMTRAERRHLH